MSQVPLVAVAIAAAAIPPAVLAARVWKQRREPGAKPFVAMQIVLVVFDLLYAGSMVVADESIHYASFLVLVVLTLLSTITWLLFVLEYIGRVRILTWQLVGGLLAIPAVEFLLLLWPAGSDRFLTSYAVVERAGVFVNDAEFGSLGLAFAALGFVALLAGVVMLLTFVVADRRRYGLQTSVLALVGVLPGVTVLLRVLEISPLAPLNLTPFAWAVGALLVLYALEKWDLFGFAPAVLRVGQAAAFDDLGEAVVIVDERERIVDANTHATELLGGPDPQLVQRPLEAVFGTAVDVGADDQTIRLETDRGHRRFDLSTSDIEGSWGETIGYTLVLHDVTAETQRRQRFEVLNRILRHNLRNTMNAVVGYSRELGAEVDGSAAWMVDRIEDQTTNLVELSEKARNIDRVTTPSSEPATFDVAASLQRVSERLAEDYEGVTITVDAPSELTVTTHEVIFEEVVQYAADSLVRYNDADDRRIFFSATPTDGERPWISCTITSNGDPVPDDERLVIERGQETPLDHSHDLDLWLVSWGVETLGGDLRFIVDDDWPGLSLSIPDVQEVEDGDGVAGGADGKSTSSP